MVRAFAGFRVLLAAASGLRAPLLRAGTAKMHPSWGQHKAEKQLGAMCFDTMVNPGSVVRENNLEKEKSKIMKMLKGVSLIMQKYPKLMGMS